MLKRGAITQQVLIALIILIFVAAVLFLFLRLIPYKAVSEKEACHQSVVLRGKSIMGVKPGQLLVPLNCKTQSIEISSMNEETIKREIANAMYDCWWMLGEGKIQFWSESAWKEFAIPVVGKPKSICIICSRIVFDKKIKEKNLQLDMASYIEKTKIPLKNITYLEYFTEESNAKLPTDVEAGKITTDHDYAVLFMGIEGDEWWEPWWNDLKTVGGLTAGSLFLAGPKTTGALAKATFKVASSNIASISKVVPAVESSADPIIKTIGIKAWWLIPVFMTLQLGTNLYYSTLVASYCDGERKGCMQVMLVQMNATQLAKICSTIESIP
ncbi:MAG: hypothetical protein QXW65_01965 [Candidatus Pacearchaeota archaeon]